MKKQFLSFLLLLLYANCILAQTETARKGKEARLVNEFGRYSCEDIKARLQNFQLMLNEEPKSRGVVFVYEGKYPNVTDYRNGAAVRYILPSFGESAFRTREMQDAVAFFKFPMENWLFVNGGFRETFTVEFWLVPDGAAFPKPTPTLETIKYSKGVPRKAECGDS